MCVNKTISMDTKEELKQSLLHGANNAIGDLLYTAICDTCNEIISVCPGVDEAAALKAANKVATKYFEEGVKVRKKPAPRAKTTKSPKPQSMDLLSAANKKQSSQLPITTWSKHPGSDKYSFASIYFDTGYPLRSNKTGKLVAMVTEKDAHAPSKDDLKIALTYNLEYEEDSEFSH